MPFNPKYTITEKVLNNLTLIASSREVIEQSYLIPKWEAKLRRQALLHNTHSSTAIEGNKLTLEQVEALADGKKIIATNKDKQEVLNYLKALEKIPALAEKGKFKKETMLDIQHMVTKGTLENSADCGVFRSRQVYVGRRIFDVSGFREEVEYMPPETEKVPGLVEEFLNWLNLEETWQMNPVLLAGIVHYEIVRIHPFIDGNGRTARLSATLILYLSGFDTRRIFALDDYYDRDRAAYYAALKTVQTNEGNLTNWLEYFTSGVAYSVNAVKETILKLGQQRKKGRETQIALTLSQMKIIELINAKGRITNKDLQILFKISAQAVHKELTKLVEFKVIKSQGQGRSLYYVLT